MIFKKKKPTTNIEYEIIPTLSAGKVFYSLHYTNFVSPVFPPVKRLVEIFETREEAENSMKELEEELK